MTELKTLKDLDFQVMSVNPRENQIIDCVNEQLKQEAIKWVKSKMPISKKEIENRVAVNKWIIVFFNISEEDLKGGKENDKNI